MLMIKIINKLKQYIIGHRTCLPSYHFTFIFDQFLVFLVFNLIFIPKSIFLIL